MKERWPEMLEYQQKVQAMTDLERHRAIIALVEDACADAYKCGAEEALCAVLPAETPEWFREKYALYTSPSPYTGRQNCEDMWTDLRAHLLGEGA